MTSLIIAVTVLAWPAPHFAFSAEKATFTSDLGAAPQVEESAVFVLKDEANVVGDRILISEIASCEGSTSVCDEAYAVYLGEAPAPGRSTVLSAEKIGQMIESEWPGLGFQLKGAKFCRIQADVQEISEEQVASALTRALSEKSYDDDGEAGSFRVSLARIMTRGNFKLRPGEFTITFPDLSWGDDDSALSDLAIKKYFGSRQRRLRVEFKQEKSLLRDALTAEFSVQEYLPVAARDMLRGEIPRDADTRLAWVETDRDAGTFVSQGESVTGRKLKQPVIAGRPFDARFLEIPLVAKKGRTAQLIVKKGDMEIQAQVKLLGNGGYGQVVEAEYLKTKKRVRVRVVDAETVQMVF